MATATKTTGFKVSCPLCGALEGLKVQVTDLTVTCCECDEEVSKADLQAAIRETERLVRWLAMAEEV